MNPKYLTVSALTSYIKTKLETDQHLQVIALKGEISNFKLHSRGHLYFSMKDDKAQINAIMFAGDAKSLELMPKDGDQVLVLGKISLYEPSGSYSIQVMKLSLDGVGVLYKKYEALKKELEALGYFKESHKKPIPSFPKCIGVITSQTGAVISDISNTINRRYRLVELILYPATVQGPSSAESIAKQIKRANMDKKVDVLIVGRGGGSIEDLWGFNEREVADAIYESEIPIISAVGHETDFTIADFVADLRAPTPTAAAELATPSQTQLSQYAIDSAHQLKRLLKDILNQKALHMSYLEERLEVSSPFNKLKAFDQTLFQLQKRLEASMFHIHASKVALFKQINQRFVNPTQLIDSKKDKLAYFKEKIDQSYYHIYKDKLFVFNTLKESLHLLSPLHVMDKGYGLLSKNQKIVSSITSLKKDDTLSITLKDGIVETVITNIKEKKHGKPII
jgi:exodeoxyribonuclease VII large subunit